MADRSVLDTEFPQDGKHIALRNFQEHVELNFICICYIFHCDRARKQPTLELCVRCPVSASLVGMLDMVRTPFWNQLNTALHDHIDHNQPLVLHLTLANPQNTAMCYIHVSWIKLFSQHNSELNAPQKSRKILQHPVKRIIFLIFPVLWQFSTKEHTIKI